MGYSTAPVAVHCAGHAAYRRIFYLAIRLATRARRCKVPGFKRVRPSRLRDLHNRAHPFCQSFYEWSLLSIIQISTSTMVGALVVLGMQIAAVCDRRHAL